jgi:uncharacterized phage infection (PIP) family protein YhgE
MNTFKQFIKTPETYTGMIIALAVQFIFFFIWLTAYDGVHQRLNNLNVVIVNQDQQLDPVLIEKLKTSLPFTIEEQTSLEIAKQQLDMRNWNMIIHIPAEFSTQFRETKNPAIEFYINQSTATQGKAIMDTAARQITAQMNQHFNQQGIEAKIIKTNDVPGFTPTMIPLLMVLASFVGSMLMSLQLNIATKKLQKTIRKWELFWSRLTVNLMSSMISASITLIFFTIFTIQINQSWFIVWLFQVLLYFTFLSVTQLSFVILGKYGVYFNILLLATQLVTSGAIVPQTLLSDAYQWVGTFLPATYGAEGYFNIIFGGGNLIVDFKHLLGILIIALLITTGKIALSSKTINTSIPTTTVTSK